MASKTYIDCTSFAKKIHPFHRPIIQRIKQQFDITILATAAPYCYAKIIAEQHLFDDCVATNFLNLEYNTFFETAQTHKKDAVLALLKTYNINHIDTTITDHIDDLPLLRLSKENFIIAPNKHLKKTLKTLAIPYKTLPAASTP